MLGRLLVVSLLLTGAYSEKRLNIAEINESYIRDAFYKEILKARNDSSPCKRQLFTLVDNVVNPSDQVSFLNSFKFFDAWGKAPSGIMYGNLYDLGNWKQCITISKEMKLPFTNIHETFTGKYCQVKIPIVDIVGFVNPDFKFKSSENEDEQNPLAGVSIGIGICIPNICDETNIAEILSSALDGVKVTVNRCSVEERQPFEPVDYFAM